MFIIGTHRIRSYELHLYKNAVDHSYCESNNTVQVNRPFIQKNIKIVFYLSRTVNWRVIFIRVDFSKMYLFE